jgi:gentisate 1,2-dioxygenase
MVDEKWSARFRTRDQIRSHGAIGNLNDGVEITIHGVPTRLIA